MDWTTVTVAAITGLAGIGGGWIGAWKQGETEIVRLKAEHDTLERQLDEEHFKIRKEIYHSFLVSAFEYHLHASSTEQRFADATASGAWMREFESCYTEVSLFGTADVRRRADELEDAIANAMNVLGRAEKEKRDRQQAYAQEAEPRFLKAWNAVVEAMRQDVAPDRTVTQEKPV
jgi:hypothetical protein